MAISLIRGDALNASFCQCFNRVREHNGNAIVGSEKFMNPELPKVPATNIPDGLKSAAHFQVTCPADVQQIHTCIWTDLTK